MIEARAFRAWATGHALPLWLRTGFDAEASRFEEQLDFALRPVAAAPRRVMVQARQVAVYALATRRGWIEARAQALAAGAAMIRDYRAGDGGATWVFSLTHDGAVADPTRDLYAHAFVLFALAHLIALDPADATFAKAVADTLDFLDTGLADEACGGFRECHPARTGARRQNPHMHLLEAYLALHAVTADPRYLDRAAPLVALANDHFVAPGTGMLREFFDDRWAVLPAPGRGAVEPGHLFEWAWLLRDYRSRGGAGGGFAGDLVRAALRHGVNPASGRIVDEIDETGLVTNRASRCWTYCEAIKCLSVETAAGAVDHRELIEAMFGRLNTFYCPPALSGGWIDQRDATDRPASIVMPASTLYHLMFALAEWEDAFAGG